MSLNLESLSRCPSVKSYLYFVSNIPSAVRANLFKYVSMPFILQGEICCRFVGSQQMLQLLLILLLLLLLLLTAIEFSLGGISLYTSTDKTNKNKRT